MATSTSKMKFKNISIPIFLIVHFLLVFSWIILDFIVFVPDIHRLIFLIFIEVLFVVIYLKTVIGNLIEKIVMMVMSMILLVFSYFYYDSILMYTTLFNDSEVTYDECLEIIKITDNYPPEKI
ncbi:hypothetical protein ACE193_23345 [Bernardetia sp. OM2101]|uniref:hypothetical protein n=1 Tax=Bernardetia sp. OM2101 TaxID=3344876 RepID=UPI0035CEC494